MFVYFFLFRITRKESTCSGQFTTIYHIVIFFPSKDEMKHCKTDHYQSETVLCTHSTIYCAFVIQSQSTCEIINRWKNYFFSCMVRLCIEFLQHKLLCFEHQILCETEQQQQRGQVSSLLFSFSQHLHQNTVRTDEVVAHRKEN